MSLLLVAVISMGSFMAGYALSYVAHIEKIKAGSQALLSQKIG